MKKGYWLKYGEGISNVYKILNTMKLPSDYIHSDIDVKNNLLLLKYSTKFLYDSLKFKDKIKWTLLMREMRGIVIDYRDWKIVSRPYPKFFNLAYDLESAEDPEAYIGNLPQNERVLATEKKDGVLIIVSNYKNKLLVHTAGSFKNDYITIAKSLLTKEQKKVIKKFPNFTFLFELIAPETRVVIDYGTEKSLYLTGVRNILTGELYTHDSPNYTFFSQFFKTLPIITFKNIKTAARIAKESTNSRIEGYVLKFPSTGKLIKLKTEYYFRRYIAQRKLGIPGLYRLYCYNKTKFEERLNSVTDEEFKDYIIKVKELFRRFDKKYSHYSKEKRIKLIKAKFPKKSVGNILDVKKLINLSN